MAAIPIYRPYVFLRCRKCGKKTDHVLINTVATGKGFACACAAVNT